MKHKVYSFAFSELNDWNAYCRHCDWSDHTDTAKSKARYHVGKTGHTVDVYAEKHFWVGKAGGR